MSWNLTPNAKSLMDEKNISRLFSVYDRAIGDVFAGGLNRLIYASESMARVASVAQKVARLIPRC